ncbi:hypothetical protein GCM10010910_01310 [Microbacterium nanhaiense]|uniref:Uncharacterized protein n=1 Tax=Microbacterium nanhaiense TaxID=1301026 RepID=A0ABQ2MX96_9MICO|nr:hypothetical protein [Microbacterium nanhaiense]GGO59113.1 hypothetical protein GCM10010910_01310 [Microbacterium nanhaiense]
MTKIRDDFNGITILRTDGGLDVILRAGDTVPDGLSVGEHLIAKQAVETSPAAPTVPPKAGPGSSAKAWREYGVRETSARGMNIDIPEDASKADIIDALESAGIPTE